MNSELLWQLSACDMAQGIRDRAFTSEDIMLSVAARIEERNEVLNAIVYNYSDEAIVQARDADHSLSEGRNCGMLHGVPVTIKTNIDVEGQPTPNGVAAYQGVIASEDSPVVRNHCRANQYPRILHAPNYRQRTPWADLKSMAGKRMPWRFFGRSWGGCGCWVWTNPPWE